MVEYPVPQPGEGRCLRGIFLGRVPYAGAWHAMRQFTERRDDSTQDQLWCLEHEPVFTRGISHRGRADTARDAGAIPTVQSDRGGRLSYHGPGQLLGYLLLDLRRLGLSIRSLVTAVEGSVIGLLQRDWRLCAQGDRSRPGVYVAEAKIASLGLRVKRGCCYHGCSLNVDVDLDPFSRIDPCGEPDLAVTSLRRLLGSQADLRLPPLAHRWGATLAKQLGYEALRWTP